MRSNVSLSINIVIRRVLQPVEPNSPPKYALRDDRLVGTTDSWRQWYEAREVDEWLQTVGGVLETGWNDQ